MNHLSKDVAFLVYEPLRQRRADNSFDGNSNIGASVVADVLTRAGIAVGYCSPETAHDYRLVLVSLTSTNDVFAFYRAVALRPEWQAGVRTFLVLGGGFGMQNPTAIRRYVDFAFFGRAHVVVADLVRQLLDTGTAEHASLMRPSEPSAVAINQAPLYAPTIDVRSGTARGFTEEFTGCPLKCLFCHYTWAREHSGGVHDSYVQTTLSNSMPELTWEGLAAYGQKAGRIRVAIDGFSERLRFLYGKTITDDDIVMGIERIGRFGPNTTTLLVYNIANMPLETDDDREALYRTLRRAAPRHHVIVVIHSTPFRPSLATPMQWEAVTIEPDWSRRRAEVIHDSPQLRAVHSFTLETSYSHVLSAVAERATTESDRLVHAIVFSPGLNRGRSADKLKLMRREFDLAPYLRRYDLDEPHPGWFVNSYVGDQIKTAARVMREKMSASAQYPAVRPAGNSMVAARLKQQGLLAAVVADYQGYGTSKEWTDRVEAP